MSMSNSGKGCSNGTDGDAKTVEVHEVFRYIMYSGEVSRVTT